MKKKKNHPRLLEVTVKKHLKRNPKSYSEVFPEFKKLSLKDYQIKGVNWILKNWFEKRGCILADEMGLGKNFKKKNN